MTITLNFTSIFAWIGGLVCLVVSLWALAWIVIWIRAAGELLGLWESLGRGIRGSISWVLSGLGRRSNNSSSSEGKHSSGT